MKSEIKRIFDESVSTYGLGRICGQLRKSGRKASYGKVSRYTADMGCNSVHTGIERAASQMQKSRGAGYPNLVAGKSSTNPHKRYAVILGKNWRFLR